MAINFSFSQTGTSRFAKVIGSAEPKFLIGKETVYQGTNHGLYNTSIPTGGSYDPAEYSDDYGFWAYFVAPTAKGESNYSFTCLNTYDRAKFSFGLMQYAAHVPNGDFVKFFRELLMLPSGPFYFPKLVVQNGRIAYREATGSLTRLENDVSTQGLMDYLNPTLDVIENQELVCSARMVHWATKDPANRRLQLKVAVEHFKANMKSYATSYNLDGFPAKVCQVVCDIRHQGRATSQQIISALNTNGNHELAFNKLLQLGQPLYASRISTIRSVIIKLVSDGKFGKKYSMSKRDFV